MNVVGGLVTGLGSTRLKPVELIVFVLSGDQLPLVSELRCSMRYVVPVVPMIPVLTSLVRAI